MMYEWGFSSIASNQSDLDRTDFRFIEAIGTIEPSIFWCIGCGSCTATCISAQFNNFNPRKIFQSVRCGLVKDLNDEISKCLLCGKCQMVCPRHVNTRNILSNLKLIIGQNAL